MSVLKREVRVGTKPAHNRGHPTPHPCLVHTSLHLPHTCLVGEEAKQPEEQLPDALLTCMPNHTLQAHTRGDGCGGRWRGTCMLRSQANEFRDQIAAGWMKLPVKEATAAAAERGRAHAFDAK